MPKTFWVPGSQWPRDVVFIPDRALSNAVDPGFAQWRKARMEPLRRAMREHARARRAKEKRLHGRAHTIPDLTRKEVYRRDAGKCVRCGAEVAWEEWRCHHVIRIPRARSRLRTSSPSATIATSGSIMDFWTRLPTVSTGFAAGGKRGFTKLEDPLAERGPETTSKGLRLFPFIISPAPRNMCVPSSPVGT